ncbi:MAG: hydantoinase/oxoprolinase family protein [Candidatus Bipolaricaulota bacterium]|nr:hydantoinase/oxoprolinase family protein [Candidatus Bipolaricaulota bacterium]MDW8126543.1 hydantoinase/oxoprolinase family protein [Candidatus Bipolaricaulota bacterium]
MITVGVDIGGTFTDLVTFEKGQIRVMKLPTSRPPSSAVLQGLMRLRPQEPARIVHGTTIATNALLEGKWAKTALLTTAGFRDVLEIGRQHRPKLYDLFCDRPEPLVPREWRLEVPERLDYQGKVLRPLDEQAVRNMARRLKGNVDSVAVVFLFSFVNPGHERRTREILVEEGLAIPITLSSEVLPEVREFERTSTTVMTAALRPIVEKYLLELEAALGAEQVGTRLLIMQSNGGVAGPKEAARAAATLLLSGPAGGVIGARFVASQAGFKNFITFDMGGTSTDVSLVLNGDILYTTEKEIAGRPVRLPMVDVHTVGAGGGSIAWIDEGGVLQVGPKSAGADPGPACYGRGGQEPTVTDAHLCLGHLPAARPIGGLPSLSTKHAQQAIWRVGKKLGLELEKTAFGILEVVEATMERAIRVISVERGYEPTDFALVAFGGAGPLHAASLARKLGIPLVFVPAYAGVLSALGLVTADLVHTYVRSLVTPLTMITVAKLNAILKDMRGDAERLLMEEGVSPQACEYRGSADLRYRGQGFELNLPLPTRPLVEEDIPDLVRRFHDLHAQRYGFANFNAEIELVSLRLTAIGHTEKPALPKISPGPSFSHALKERRPVWFPEVGWEKTPVYVRSALPAGAEFFGPAVVEGLESTVIIPPQVRVHVDAFGNLIMEV